MKRATFARVLRKASSRAEVTLWQSLRAQRLNGLQFRRQVPCGLYVADFLCHAARLVIEVDGATHSTDAELRHDRRRDAWFRAQGWRVLRFRNDEVYTNLDGVIETILAHLPRLSDVAQPPSLSLPRSAGEGTAGAREYENGPQHESAPSPAKRGRGGEGGAPLRKSVVDDP